MSASTMPETPDTDPSGVLLEVIREHYASVYRLAFASLDDMNAARKAATFTFAKFWLQENRPPSTDQDRRLYELALENLQRKEFTHPPAAAKPDENEPGSSWMLEPAIVEFNQAVDRLGKIEHLLLVMVYVLGWQPDLIGKLLEVGEKAVLAQIALFHSRLCPLLERAPESAIPPAGNLPELPNELVASADQRAAAILQARWPAPILGEAEFEALTQQIKQLAESMRQKEAKSRPYRRITIALVAAAVLLLCLTGGLGAWLLNAQGMGGGVQGTPTATAYGASTAFPQVTKVAPLTRRSSDEDIRQRWVESPTLWHSLSADAQTWRYGPRSYFGLPRSYRDQAWIVQPDQSIVLKGLLGETPGQSYLIAQGRVFGRSAAEDENRSEPWDGSLEALLPVEPLHSMIFPASSTWAIQPGEFQAVETTRLAGREAIGFDWINSEGQREARLWLDTQTGIILRARIYGGDNYQTLIDDSLMTSLALERSEPPPGLITSARLGETQPASGDPAFSPLSPTPTAAVAPQDRPSPPINSAPPGFDPTGSYLTFHFTRDPGVANATTDTAAQPAELIADGYNLGNLQFGLPWTLRCIRSPDGQRLAFNTASDGATPADDSVRWFNLSKPQAIYQPLPNLEAVSFAFSPDSRRLAVAGQGNGYSENGVYLVDIGTGENRLLLVADQAHSLVWSPDGEFLALIGIPEGQESASMLVLHVRTSQLAYQSPPGVIDQAPADSPIAAWGLPFPVEMGGMDECGAPPQP